jgi:hypothetical protein
MACRDQPGNISERAKAEKTNKRREDREKERVVKGGLGATESKGIGSAGANRGGGKDGEHVREGSGHSGGMEGRGNAGRKEDSKLTAEERHRYCIGSSTLDDSYQACEPQLFKYAIPRAFRLPYVCIDICP